MAIPTIPDIKELMEAGVHFGHASGHWHPKMKPYIFAARNKLHIIDLEKSKEQLEKVLPILEERIRDGKTMVLVGTKKQVSDKVKQIGEELNVNYVNIRWLGGCLTNFGEMQKSIARMKRIEAQLAGPEAQSIIKKERVMLDNELKRMLQKFGGLRNLNKKPDFVFVVDPENEKNAIKEARNQGLEVFAICDTNADPSKVDHVIPANDDGVKSLNLILDLVAKTIANGQKLVSVKGDKDDAEKPAEKKEVEKAEEKADKSADEKNTAK